MAAVHGTLCTIPPRNLNQYNRNHGNAVEGFWALRDNIYCYKFSVLNFPVVLDGQFTSLFIIAG